jgi:hypothetical protein
MAVGEAVGDLGVWVIVGGPGVEVRVGEVVFVIVWVGPGVQVGPQGGNWTLE